MDMWVNEQLGLGEIQILKGSRLHIARKMMNKTTADVRPNSRIEAEIQRERNERLHNDDVKTGANLGDDFRIKDARENDSSTNLHRSRGR
jgi:hypothetical protein